MLIYNESMKLLLIPHVFPNAFIYRLFIRAASWGRFLFLKKQEVQAHYHHPDNVHQKVNIYITKLCLIFMEIYVFLFNFFFFLSMSIKSVFV